MPRATVRIFQASTASGPRSGQLANEHHGAGLSESPIPSACRARIVLRHASQCRHFNFSVSRQDRSPKSAAGGLHRELRLGNNSASSIHEVVEQTAEGWRILSRAIASAKHWRSSSAISKSARHYRGSILMDAVGQLHTRHLSPSSRLTDCAL